MSSGDLLWKIWFVVGLLAAGALFLAKLRFGSRYYQRQERRWLHSYTSRRLEPLDAEGRIRSVKVHDEDEEAKKKSAVPVSEPVAPTAKKTGKPAKA